MTLSPSLSLPVTENSQVGEARRLFVRLAASAGLSGDDCARVGLIATELGTNLVKHARNGELLGRSLANEGGAGIAIHAVDRGPGIKNIEECLRDGFSTAGSSGTGLGSLRRQSDSFQIYSLDKVGTVIALHIFTSPPVASGFEAGLITSPILGESECGDAGLVLHQGGHTTCLLADGLGHGPQAAEASDEAVRIARAHPGREPADLMLLVHDALKKTRGAAVSIVRITPDTGRLAYCSVGNISTSLVRHGFAKTLPTGNGIVGHVLPRLETTVLPWTGQDMLVMHSDGLHANTQTYSQPGLLVRPAPLIAGMLYACQKRGRDDASVLVLRSAEQP